MAQHYEEEIAYYYDSHPTLEDLMGETAIHAELIDYLKAVLIWQFHGQHCAIYKNLNFYQTNNPKEYPIAPDLAVIRGVNYQRVSSWKIGRSGPAPQVVFEIASKETWDKDLEEKPLKYAQMGVKEYFAYDPNKQLLLPEAPSRLLGWHLEQATGQMREMRLRLDGCLWSPHLQSYLVPDGQYLRLSDSRWQRRLTEAEAKDKLAEEEARRADAETRRAERLAEKLRSLGIDPNQL